MRTKQGLATAKANEVKLGRPKGSKNKERVLDPYKAQTKHFLQIEGRYSLPLLRLLLGECQIQGRIKYLLIVFRRGYR